MNINKEIVFIVVCFNILFLGCLKEGATEYVCNGTGCEQSVNGDYTNLASCERNCGSGGGGGGVATYPLGSVFCNGIPTAVVDVINPLTGKTWMDRDLGASRVAISPTDVSGDLYQWGRRSDGHQCRNSPVTTVRSSSDQPNGSFIIIEGNVSEPTYDWRLPQNSNLWQGLDGINNPCPTGYRVPTRAEVQEERLSWNQDAIINGSFASPLKWSVTNARNFGYGEVVETLSSHRWTSTINGRYSYYIDVPLEPLPYRYSPLDSFIYRGWGLAVRCIKD